MTKIYLSGIIVLSVVSSCVKFSTDIETEGISLIFSDAINVVWHFDGLNTNGSWKDAGDFESFTFIIGDSTFRGFDGCNWFGGSYLLSDNQISFHDIVSTEIYCALSVFSTTSLQGTFKLEITSKQLVLRKSGMVLQFTSNTTNGVKGTPLIGKTWQVTASNSTEFLKLKAQDLLPRFEFDQNRKFRVEWYCSKNNIFGCNERFGFYGLGDNNRFLFWAYGGSYSHPHSLDNFEDQLFVEEIFKANFYSISNNVLKLQNNNSGIFYEVSPQ